MPQKFAIFAPMKTRIFMFLLATSCVLLSSQGCATLGASNKEPTVRLSDEGRIYVGETYTGLTKLVSQLKADGIKPGSRITIEIPQNTSQNAITAISRELLSKGYRRSVFSKPLKATAEKGVDPLLKHLEPKSGK